MVMRILKMLLGLVLLGAGIAMLFLPGPGLLAMALGIGLVLSQSEPGRRVMSRLRLRARARFGSQPVRDVERRLPREIVGDQNTTQMRLDLEAYARERKKRKDGRSR